MGSQPSSFSAHREIKGFVVTKQLSARHKVKSSLSKKFSRSEILTSFDYDARDLLDRSQSRFNKTSFRRPHSENIGLNDAKEQRIAGSQVTKKLKTAPVGIPKLPKIDSRSSIVSKENSQNSKCQDQNISVVCTGKNHIEDTINVLELAEINKHLKENMESVTEDTASYEHLNHWVNKNEPYVQVTDVHQHDPVSKERSHLEMSGQPTDDSPPDENVHDEEDDATFQTKVTEFFIDLRKAMKEFKSHQNDRTPEGYITDDLRQNILKIYNSFFSFKTHSLKRRNEVKLHIAEETLHTDHETIVIFCKISHEILQNGYRNPEGKSVAALFKPLKNILAFLQNTSDTMHAGIGKTILDQKRFVDTVFEKIKEWTEPHFKKELKENDNILCGTLLAILHNLVQLEEFVPRLRELGIIQLVKPFLESHNEVRRMTSLSILANVVNEEESEILQNKSDLISFIIERLKKAMKDKIRRCLGWSVREITRAIRMIAKSDTNKRTVVTHGALPLLVELANEPKNVEEQKEAVGALWTLSFDKQNQEEIINDKNCEVISTLLKLYNSTDVVDVKRICGKALWIMRDKLKSSENYKNIGEKFSLVQSPKDKSDTHVMISYNWGHQGVVQQIAHNLRHNGLKVWMDIDDMHGSTLQAMASAVEKADIVLLCYSQKYKNSDNCRAEAEYAFQLKKKITPLRMEAGYKGDGWLGFIIGSKLFYDFSGKYPFEKKLKELVKDVQTSLKAVKGVDVHQQEVKIEISPDVQKIPAAEKGKMAAAVDIEKVKVWTNQHVGKWLDKNKLPRNLLGRLSGIEVAFLHVLVHESPDVFYKTIADQLAVKDILTMAKLRFALESLSVNV